MYERYQEAMREQWPLRFESYFDRRHRAPCISATHSVLMTIDAQRRRFLTVAASAEEALVLLSLLGLARGWDRGAGPRALLACPSGERHDLGLIILGLALRDRGWRMTFLGPDTPIETLAAAADQLAPDVVVLSSLAREPLVAAAAQIARMASTRPVLLAGPGADAELAERASARLLAGSPIEAAAEVSA